MIAPLRYGGGVPWYRLRGLERSLGIPLPMATQCEVVHNGDTSLRVLSLDRDADISPQRTWVFTSGLVWIYQDRRIALSSPGASTPARIWPRY